jgi:hypothetical protein
MFAGKDLGGIKSKNTRCGVFFVSDKDIESLSKGEESIK